MAQVGSGLICSGIRASASLFLRTACDNNVLSSSGFSFTQHWPRGRAVMLPPAATHGRERKAHATWKARLAADLAHRRRPSGPQFAQRLRRSCAARPGAYLQQCNAENALQHSAYNLRTPTADGRLGLRNSKTPKGPASKSRSRYNDARVSLSLRGVLNNASTTCTDAPVNNATVQHAAALCNIQCNVPGATYNVQHTPWAMQVTRPGALCRKDTAMSRPGAHGAKREWAKGVSGSEGKS